MDGDVTGDGALAIRNGLAVTAAAEMDRPHLPALHEIMHPAVELNSLYRVHE